MSFESDTANPSKTGGSAISDTPSIALLNRRLGISPSPRMLTPYELDLLRRSKSEMARVTREILAEDPR
jgi:hypothetical protein